MADLFDHYDENDNIHVLVYTLAPGGKWQSQVFTTESAYTIEEIDLLAYRGVGSDPGDLIVSIREVDGEGEPLDVDKDDVTGTVDAGTFTDDTAGLWYKITLDAGIELATDTQYVIVARTTNPNAAHRVHWRCESASPPGYADGSRWESNDAGSTWSETTGIDCMFRCYGTAGVAPKEGTGSIAAVTTLSGSAKASRKCSGTTAIVTALSGDGKIYKPGSGTIAIVTALSGRASTIYSASGSIGILVSISGVGFISLLGGFYRANNKRGYLNARMVPSDSQMELQVIDYGGGAKDRNIPTHAADKLMQLVIWGIQYPNPSAAADREIVSAEWDAGQVFDIVRAQEGTEAHDHYIGDNVALLLTAEMTREILILSDFTETPEGSIAYTEDTDVPPDGTMEVIHLLPDDEVSDEGYKKILVSGGPGEPPYWQFCWAMEVGGKKRDP
jgi:hypothetical protein